MFSKPDPLDASIADVRQKLDAASKFCAKRSATITDRDLAMQAAADAVLTAALKNDTNTRRRDESVRLATECETYARTWPLLVKNLIEAIRNIAMVAARAERTEKETKLAEAFRLDELAEPLFRRLGEILQIPADKRLGYYQPIGHWLHLPTLAAADENETISTAVPEPGNRTPFAVPKPGLLRAEAGQHAARAERFEKLATNLTPRLPKKTIIPHNHPLHESPVSIFGAAQAGLTPPEPMPHADVQISDLEDLFRQAVTGIGRTVGT
jgi:hypothetical protein